MQKDSLNLNNWKICMYLTIYAQAQKRKWSKSVFNSRIICHEIIYGTVYYLFCTCLPYVRCNNSNKSQMLDVGYRSFIPRIVTLNVRIMINKYDIFLLGLFDKIYYSQCCNDKKKILDELSLTLLCILLNSLSNLFSLKWSLISCFKIDLGEKYKGLRIVQSKVTELFKSLCSTFFKLNDTYNPEELLSNFLILWTWWVQEVHIKWYVEYACGLNSVCNIWG